MPDLEDAERLLRDRLGSRLRVGFPLAPLTSFRIGGPAALFVEAEDDGALGSVGQVASQTGASVAVIGKGSNVLVSDGGFPGIVVRLGRGYRWAGRDGDLLTAGGAMPLPALAGVAMRHRLAGLEFGVAIPASLGGAVKMNAGAHGRSMSEVIERVEVYSLARGARQFLLRPTRPDSATDARACRPATSWSAPSPASSRAMRRHPVSDGRGERLAPPHAAARRAELWLGLQEPRRRPRREADRGGRSEGPSARRCAGVREAFELHRGGSRCVFLRRLAADRTGAYARGVAHRDPTRDRGRVDGGRRRCGAAEMERRKSLRRWTIAGIALVLVATLAVAATYTPLFAAKRHPAPRL